MCRINDDILRKTKLTISLNSLKHITMELEDNNKLISQKTTTVAIFAPIKFNGIDEIPWIFF